VLVLSRRVDEAIQIGPDITVLVTAIYKLDGYQPVVRIGIDAPRHVLIKRSELNAERRGPETGECENGGRQGRTGHLPGAEVVTGCTTDAHECRCGRRSESKF
jgi:carbon storage regulator CsrA